MPATDRTVAIEPRLFSADMQDGLQAQVHDPLWMVAQQWRFGELQADDAGSPAVVDLIAESAPINRYRPGPGTGPPVRGWRSTDMPLECLVEQEAVGTGGQRSPGRVVEAGLHFLRMLTANGVGAYRAAYRALYASARPDDAARRTWDEASLRF